MRYLPCDNAAMDRSGHNRKMSQSLAGAASIRLMPHGGTPDGAGERPSCQWQSKIVHIWGKTHCGFRGFTPSVALELEAAVIFPSRGAEARRCPPLCMERHMSWWALMRKLWPRMLTMWQWCSTRSIRAAAMTSPPSTPPRSSKPLFEVSTGEARTWCALISWKNSTAPSRLTGRKAEPPILHRRGGFSCKRPRS